MDGNNNNKYEIIYEVNESNKEIYNDKNEIISTDCNKEICNVKFKNNHDDSLRVEIGTLFLDNNDTIIDYNVRHILNSSLGENIYDIMVPYDYNIRDHIKYDKVDFHVVIAE